MTDPAPDVGRVIIDRPAPHVAAVAIDRPAKRNGFTPEMLAGLSRAYAELDADPEVRAVVLHAVGGHFTGGLDLNRMAASQAAGETLFADGGVDPLGLSGRPISKPVVAAVEGTCFTIGIELILAADIAVAGQGARFAQLEVKRAIMAYGGATVRMVQRFGWGEAMRLLLTGDDFGAAEARRIGLVQEVVPDGRAYMTALDYARRIAEAAPLAVQATLAHARLAQREGEAAAVRALPEIVARLAATEDGAEGVASFKEKRPPRWRGR